MIASTTCLLVIYDSIVSPQFSGGNSTRVEARDVDGPGVNSEVSYDKAGKDRDKFSVDKDTGIVTVAPGSHHTPHMMCVPVTPCCRGNRGGVGPRGGRCSGAGHHCRGPRRA